MSRTATPPSRRKHHRVDPNNPTRTICGRHLTDPAVVGYLTEDPDEVTCRGCQNPN